MKELKKGVKILDYVQNKFQTQTRLMISSGTSLVKDLDLPFRNFYIANAYIPLEPWRSPDPEELEILVNFTSEFIQGNLLRIVVLPNSILRHFEELGINNIQQNATQSNRVIQHIQTSLNYKEILREIKEYLLEENLIKTEEPVIFHNIQKNTPKLNTVTTTSAYMDKPFIGLHIDSWYNFPINDRANSPGRICINLGLDSRYFLFINLPAEEIYRCVVKKKYLSSHISKNKRIDLSNLVPAFCELYPNYPVIKVRISPGEAYIAPTENIIHDGSTFNSKSVDLNLTIRGHFYI